MPEAQTSALNRQPVRRGSPDDNIRLDSSVNFRGNFHRVVEVTSGQPAREKARRGQ
jgi:hypothetical protein